MAICLFLFIAFTHLFLSFEMTHFRNCPIIAKLSHFCEGDFFSWKWPMFKMMTHHIFTWPTFRLCDPFSSNLTQLKFPPNVTDSGFWRHEFGPWKHGILLQNLFYSSNHWILLQSIHKSLENHSEEYYCMHHIFLRITSPLATALLFTLCFCKQTGTARLDSTHENKVEVICSHNHTVSIFFSISPFCG
jgi:hypothetical protein